MGLQGLGSLVTGPPEPLRGARVVISTDSNDTAGAGEVAPKDRSGRTRSLSHSGCCGPGDPLKIGDMRAAEAWVGDPPLPWSPKPLIVLPAQCTDAMAGVRG